MRWEESIRNQKKATVPDCGPSAGRFQMFRVNLIVSVANVLVEVFGFERTPGDR